MPPQATTTMPMQNLSTNGIAGRTSSQVRDMYHVFFAVLPVRILLCLSQSGLAVCIFSCCISLLGPGNAATSNDHRADAGFVSERHL